MKMNDLKSIALDPKDIPTVTRMVPASSVIEGKEGWILLPPEDAMNKKNFDQWKDNLINGAIDKGLRDSKG